MRVQAIFKRIMLQRVKDKRTLAMMFVLPIVLLTLMFFLFQVPSNTAYKIGLISDNTSLNQNIKDMDASKAHLDVVKVDKDDRATMNDKKLDAIMKVSGNDIRVTYANQSAGTTQAMKMLVTQVVQQTQAKASQAQIESTVNQLMTKLQEMAEATSHAGGHAAVASPQQTASNYTVSSRYLYGDTSSVNSTFYDMAPIFVGAFVFFLVFLISGISLVNERTSGTLDRMLMSPVKRSEIVTGYTASYGILALLQTLVMVATAYGILGVPNKGNILWVFVINALIAIIALLFGLLLSTAAKTEFQFVQMIPIAVVPQFLFSGLIPVSTMPAVLQWIAHCMPVYYGITAMQAVVKRGQGFSAIWFDLLIMFLIAVLLYIVNVFALKTVRRT